MRAKAHHEASREARRVLAEAAYTRSDPFASANSRAMYRPKPVPRACVCKTARRAHGFPLQYPAVIEDPELRTATASGASSPIPVPRPRRADA